MKKLVVVFWILGSFVSAGFAEISKEQWIQNYKACQKQNATACRALIDNGLVSVEQCDKESCKNIALIYKNAGYIQDAIKYFQKLVDFGDYIAALYIGGWHIEEENFIEAKKYFEIACENIKDKRDMDIEAKRQSCFLLALAYSGGQGTRQDFFKASQNFKKSCDLGLAEGCKYLGVYYATGNGVRKNHSIAKEYFGKACDLGLQSGCDFYKLANDAGVQ